MSLTGSSPVPYSPRDRGDLYAFDTVWQRLKQVTTKLTTSTLWSIDCGLT